jgi:hypothetical protein
MPLPSSMLLIRVEKPSAAVAIAGAKVAPIVSPRFSRRLVFFRLARLRDFSDESRSCAVPDGDVGFDGRVV